MSLLGHPMHMVAQRVSLISYLIFNPIGIFFSTNELWKYQFVWLSALYVACYFPSADFSQCTHTPYIHSAITDSIHGGSFIQRRFSCIRELALARALSKIKIKAAKRDDIEVTKPVEKGCCVCRGILISWHEVKKICASALLSAWQTRAAAPNRYRPARSLPHQLPTIWPTHPRVPKCSERAPIFMRARADKAHTPPLRLRANNNHPGVAYRQVDGQHEFISSCVFS